MKTRLRKRFWFELIPGVIIGILFVVALMNRLYIGLIFVLINSDPILEIDTLAWVVIGVLFFVTILLLALAAYEWRRYRVAVVKTESLEINLSGYFTMRLPLLDDRYSSKS